MQVESTWCDNSILCICNHMKDQALCQKQKKNMKVTSSSASTGKVKQAIQHLRQEAIDEGDDVTRLRAEANSQ